MKISYNTTLNSATSELKTNAAVGSDAAGS